MPGAPSVAAQPADNHAALPPPRTHSPTWWTNFLRELGAQWLLHLDRRNFVCSGFAAGLVISAVIVWTSHASQQVVHHAAPAPSCCTLGCASLPAH